MEDKDKYYTPSIEEFHVGFEYQDKLTGKRIYGENKEIPLMDSDEDLISSIEREVEEGLILVKKLDKEDIESLSWNFENQEEFTFMNFNKITKYRGDKIKVKLFYVFNTNWTLISLPNNQTIFAGTIKNKSELRRVMKMIGIE